MDGPVKQLVWLQSLQNTKTLTQKESAFLDGSNIPNFGESFVFTAIQIHPTNNGRLFGPSQYLLMCLHVISRWICLYQDEIEIDARVLGYGEALSTVAVELRNKGAGEFVGQVHQSVHNTGVFNHKTLTHFSLTLFWKIFKRRSGCIPFFNYCICIRSVILLCLVWIRVSFNDIYPLYNFFKKVFGPFCFSPLPQKSGTNNGLFSPKIQL